MHSGLISALYLRVISTCRYCQCRGRFESGLIPTALRESISLRRELQETGRKRTAFDWRRDTYIKRICEHERKYIAILDLEANNL